MAESLTTTVLAAHHLLRDRIAATAQVTFPRQARNHQDRAEGSWPLTCTSGNHCATDVRRP
jgi:hypothetical protein